MRILLCVLFSVIFISLRAQTPYYTPALSFTQYPRQTDSSDLNRKWFITRYTSISASYAFFNGGSASILSAPIGLQLNRRLNNNLYAFAGLSVAPSYINFNRSFSNTNFNKNYPGSNLSSGNNFGISSRAEMGLMYMNDQRTFSISGSIGIERNSYPAFYPSNRTHQQPPALHSR